MIDGPPAHSPGRKRSAPKFLTPLATELAPSSLDLFTPAGPAASFSIFKLKESARDAFPEALRQRGGPSRGQLPEPLPTVDDEPTSASAPPQPEPFGSAAVLLSPVEKPRDVEKNDEDDSDEEEEEDGDTFSAKPSRARLGTSDSDVQSMSSSDSRPLQRPVSGAGAKYNQSLLSKGFLGRLGSEEGGDGGDSDDSEDSAFSGDFQLPVQV